MPIDFDLRLLDDNQVSCTQVAATLAVRIVPRTVTKPFPDSAPVPGVYLLLDDARQVYYVGETDDVNSRHKQHVSNFLWWNHAVYFHVQAFSSVRLRKYLQDKLFSLIRSLQSGVVLVTSLAGFKGPPPASGETFWKQMCVCGHALRILPFINNPLVSGVLPLEGVSTGNPLPPPPPPTPAWTSALQLAKALNEKYGGGATGICQILTAYKGRKAGRLWRPRLESVGVEFDPDSGLVRDWSKSRNPLP